MEILTIFLIVCILVISVMIIFSYEKLDIDVSILLNAVINQESFTEKECYLNTLNPKSYNDLKIWENRYNGFIKFENRIDFQVKPFYQESINEIYFYLKHKKLYSEVCISYNKNDGNLSYIKPCSKKDLKCKPIKI